MTLLEPAGGGDVVLPPVGPSAADQARDLFLASYPEGNTRAAYRRALREWWSWCTQHGGDPLQANRAAVDGWVRSMENTVVGRTGRALAPASITQRVSAVRTFYAYCLDEGWIGKNPVPERGKKLHLPKVPKTRTTGGPDKAEAKAMMAAAKARGPLDHAVVAVLLAQGLRAQTLCDLDRGDLVTEQGHRVLRSIGKGGRVHTQVLAPDAAGPLDAYLASQVEQGFIEGLPALFGEDADRPLFQATTRMGPKPDPARHGRLTRHQVAHLVEQVARDAGITRRITPHALRHAATTILIGEGVQMRRVQEFIGHESLTTTAAYDDGLRNLAESPAYRFAGLIT